MIVGGMTYPRRLIEVDLPIGKISDHARDGRSVHHGHITAIHIWWARKPLPSCRAATLAAMLLDPQDPNCPCEFKQKAVKTLNTVYGGSVNEDTLREVLLQFVSDFSSWDRAEDALFQNAARSLASAAHTSLFGNNGPPFLADPFCGGGSIPLEGLRIGANVYASDLNPVATLISKVTLEYVQRFGEQLLTEVERAGKKIAVTAHQELNRYYPEIDGKIPVAYISFRRIQCEGPRCGADVVLTSKFHLARRNINAIGLRLAGWNGTTPSFAIAEGPLSSFPDPTVKRGAATCLKCGYTMPVEHVREQLSKLSGGAQQALLVAVATIDANGNRSFREPSEVDLDAVKAAARAVNELDRLESDSIHIFPSERLPPIGTLGFRVQRYGMLRWRDLFTPRQLLTISTLVRLVRETIPEYTATPGLSVAVRTCLALAVDRLCDYQNTGCSWNPSGSALPHLFTRQAVPIIWDFGEANPISNVSGSWSGAIEHVVRGLRNARVGNYEADVSMASASHHPLPTDCAHILVTDPPYYDAIPYADLSDFFYVWLRRMLSDDHPSFFLGELVTREEECIVNKVASKDRDYYRRVMTAALAEARRVTRPDGIGVIIFAHKSTSGWEDLIAAMLDAGWIITASWPIDTENTNRLRARNSAVLGSSIHLVCRPREYPDGTLVTNTVGDWRNILENLPKRIHAWMPRLAEEGIVGADAIFACLGPALEIFSCYARVEKADGEVVTIKEYLEQVWAAVAREALSTVLHDVDSGALEPDARLSVIWLWTIGGGKQEDAVASNEEESETDDEDNTSTKKPTGGFILEFDAARKIAQGLGAKLEALPFLVEIKGDIARLLPVAERMKYLFSKKPEMPHAKTTKKAKQLTLFAELKSVIKEQGWSDSSTPIAGETTLDRIHQTMLLFATGRGEALKRFLVEDGIGQQAQFWILAQSLSALYPINTDEKRWVDGVLAHKKGLGFG
jgi:putative DNA methylase